MLITHSFKEFIIFFGTITAVTTLSFSVETFLVANYRLTYFVVHVFFMGIRTNYIRIQGFKGHKVKNVLRT